jgi:hypothetical protein
MSMARITRHDYEKPWYVDCATFLHYARFLVWPATCTRGWLLRSFETMLVRPALGCIKYIVSIVARFMPRSWYNCYSPRVPCQCCVDEGKVADLLVIQTYPSCAWSHSHLCSRKRFNSHHNNLYRLGKLLLSLGLGHMPLTSPCTSIGLGDILGSPTCTDAAGEGTRARVAATTSRHTKELRWSQPKKWGIRIEIETPEVRRKLQRNSPHRGSYILYKLAKILLSLSLFLLIDSPHIQIISKYFLHAPTWRSLPSSSPPSPCGPQPSLRVPLPMPLLLLSSSPTPKPPLRRAKAAALLSFATVADVA